MSQVKKENSSQDSTMTGATDFFSVPKELEINEKTLEKTAVVAEEKKWEWEEKTKMTEPSDFFSLWKTAGKIKDGTFDAVESTFDTSSNLVQWVVDTGKDLAKEVGDIRSGKKEENSAWPAMTEPSDFFSPKKLAKGGKSLVKKTFATGEAGLRAGVHLGKETISEVRKFWTGIFGKLGGKKKDTTPPKTEDDWNPKSE